jgi:hypothetical protein
MAESFRLNFENRELLMNRRNLIAVSVVAASLFTSQAVYAAPAATFSSMHAMFGKSKTTQPKTVQLTLRNDCTTARDILVGDQAMTIAPGKSVNLNLPVGTKIVANDSSATHQSGTLIAEVASYFKGNTIVLK